jgi:ubiquinone/menaquinone biosynthesis C-methylase UbiE
MEYGMASQTKSKPDPAFIAQQLRKPSGSFAPNIARKMDQVNEPLFDLTLETMQLTDHESLLEIGFGSGKFFPKIFSKANQLQVTGIDHSQEMVEMAKRDNQSLIDSGQLILDRGSSDHLPFPDHIFDKVFCNMVVYFWDQSGGHLNEIRRVLNQGGRFYTGIRAKESMLRFPFTQFGFVLYEEDEWKSILEQNGFQWIGTKKKTDPAMEEEGNSFCLESICLIAEKMS